MVPAERAGVLIGWVAHILLPGSEKQPGRPIGQRAGGPRRFGYLPAWRPSSKTSPNDRLVPEEGMIEVINQFYSMNLGTETMKGMRKNTEGGYNNGG